MDETESSFHISMTAAISTSEEFVFYTPWFFYRLWRYISFTYLLTFMAVIITIINKSVTVIL